MTAVEILEQLRSLGTEPYKKVLRNHGVQEPFFGVKIEELKKIQKRIKKDYRLALELYDTGNYDAQYLAGLIADETKMTKQDLRGWLKKANCSAICGCVVSAVAAESRHGHDLANEWIASKKENIATAGWTILSNLVSIEDDEDLNLPELKRLLQHVRKTIHEQPNKVRYVMNGFVIAVGCYVRGLTELALQMATTIGPVTVDLGNTACKVPFAPEYIQKVQKRGTIGKKRPSARC